MTVFGAGGEARLERAPTVKRWPRLTDLGASGRPSAGRTLILSVLLTDGAYSGVPAEDEAVLGELARLHHRAYCPVEYWASFSVVTVESSVHEAGGRRWPTLDPQPEAAERGDRVGVHQRGRDEVWRPT